MGKTANSGQNGYASANGRPRNEKGWRPAKPCPKCGDRESRCRITEDGAVLMCRNEAEGGRQQTLKNGETAWFHRLRDEPRLESRPRKPAKDKPAPPIADMVTRDGVYTALLSEITLDPRHQSDLIRRGFAQADIERLMFRSMPDRGLAVLASVMASRFDKETLLKVPGFYVNDAGELTLAAGGGLLVAVRDIDGQIVAMKVRPNKPSEAGKKYHLLSSLKRGGPSPGSPVHVPLGTPRLAETIRLTEGELKADLSWLLSGVPTISAPGVGVWKACLPIIEGFGCRTVHLAFDADAWANDKVAKALVACQAGLVEAGYSVRIERWSRGGDGNPKGIDDALAAGVAVEVLGEEETKAAIEEARRLAMSEEEKVAKAREEATSTLRTKAAGFASFADVLRDVEFKAALADLEIYDATEAAAIIATLSETLKKFKVREFNRSMGEARAAAERKAYGDNNLFNLIGEVVDDPHRLARAFLSQECTHSDGRTLVYHRQEFFLFNGACFASYKDISEDLTAAIKLDFDAHHQQALMRYAIKKSAGKAGDDKPPVLEKVTTRVLNNALQALRSETVAPWDESLPFWLRDGDWGDRDPLEILVAENLLVHLPTLETLPHTPRLFTPYQLSYPWIADAAMPRRWERFLYEDLWPHDHRAIRELQKWFGLLLTLDTRYQKILMLIGPPGCGKGTIVRVLTALIGKENIATPSLPGLAQPFGLSSLMGKAACIFTDVHAIGEQGESSMAFENLLKISGEDAVEINRKYHDPISMKLNARLMFVSNKLPSFRDSSGALLRRLVPLQLVSLFKGEKEDMQLTEKLSAELPGILRHFAIPGLAMLKQDGGFAIPPSSSSLIDEIKSTLNPVAVFAEECLEIIPKDIRDPINLPKKRDVFAAYCGWCAATKRRASSENTFGANLRATFPHIGDARPRDESNSGIRRYSGLELSKEGRRYLLEQERKPSKPEPATSYY